MTDNTPRYVTDAEAARLREEAAHSDVHQSVRNAVNGFDATRTALLEIAEAEHFPCNKTGCRICARLTEIRGTK